VDAMERFARTDIGNAGAPEDVLGEFPALGCKSRPAAPTYSMQHAWQLLRRVHGRF